MTFTSIIEKKKLNIPLSAEEIKFFADGAANGTIPDYQLSALLMAIRLNGMTREEIVNLTLSMAHSGEMIDLSKISGIPVDKHSTGGVGDTTTLILAPLLAACGAPVAKMSGRGLGHTGGTLDKLESIPGFNVTLDMNRFISQVQKIGVAIISQSGNLAPADKALYSLRDVTSTVDSLALAASSIMSKKLASGAQAIVLDVKTGSGALMHTLDDSISLAKIMVQIGIDAGRNVSAIVTNMSEPLGSHIGNALEVKEAIDVLSGKTKGPLLSVSLTLAAQLLVMSGISIDTQSAITTLNKKLDSGEGLEKFQQMIAMQNGDPSVCDNVSLLAQANVISDVYTDTAGYIGSMDTTSLGNIAQAMGAGRKQKTDSIDYSVGFVLHHRIGDYVSKGDRIATLHSSTELSATTAEQGIKKAISIQNSTPIEIPLVNSVINGNDI